MKLEKYMVKINKLLILTLVLYIFWYQYAFQEIPGILMILGAIVAVFGVYWLIVDPYRLAHSSMNSLMITMVIIFISSAIVTQSNLYSSMVFMNMVEYLLIAEAVYIFAVDSKQNLTFVYFAMAISIALLSIYALTNGEMTKIGQLRLGRLNPNLMSTMFTLGVYSVCMLLSMPDKNERFVRIKKIVLYAFLVVIVMAQIKVASRRGFVVLCLFLLLFFIYAQYLTTHKAVSGTNIMLLLLLMIVVLVATYLVYRYVMEETVLGERLQGQYNEGDIGRDEYKLLALKKFKEHPFMGIGLNCIAYYNHGRYAHSLYYEMLACTGIIGCGAGLIYAFGLIKKFIFAVGKEGYNYCSDSQIMRLRTDLILLFCLAVAGFAVVMIYDLCIYIMIAMAAADYDNIANEHPEIRKIMRSRK